MAMSGISMSRAHLDDGNLREVFSCYFDATTGALQLDLSQDLRTVAVSSSDTSTSGTAIGIATNIATGVSTLTGVAVVALTGVSGGAAGGFTFTGTGGIIGKTITGDANFQANTMIVNVSGTTITVDKALLGAIAAGNQFTHAVTIVTYVK